MSPIGVQLEIESLVLEEKWQRFVEWQEREHVMAEPRAPLRARLLRRGGEMLIAAGEKLEHLAGGPICESTQQHFNLGEAAK